MSRSFQFHTFDALGKGQTAMTITPTTLRSQGNLDDVLDTLAQRFAGSESGWRQILAIENTTPFSLDAKRVGRDAVFVLIGRANQRYLLVAISSATGSIGEDQMISLQATIEKTEGVAALDGVFDWLTGISPPLAAMITLAGGQADVGATILGMCVADSFFRSVEGELS